MGCDYDDTGYALPPMISIHAARVGCDIVRNVAKARGMDISIHAARVGCDVHRFPVCQLHTKFQSTQPEWAATVHCTTCAAVLTFQSTQPERAATWLGMEEI